MSRTILRHLNSAYGIVLGIVFITFTIHYHEKAHNKIHRAAAVSNGHFKLFG